MREIAALGVCLMLGPLAACASAPSSEPAGPAQASYRFFQRLTENGCWDDGKPVPAAIGLAILKCIADAKEWNPDEAPELAMAKGGRRYAPAYVAGMDVQTASGKNVYNFCCGCGLFSQDDQIGYFVVPAENREKLIELLSSLRDPGREGVR